MRKVKSNRQKRMKGKKMVATIALFAATMCFGACGENTKAENGTIPSDTPTIMATTAPNETTEMETSTETPTAAPTETPTAAPTQRPVKSVEEKLAEVLMDEEEAKELARGIDYLNATYKGFCGENTMFYWKDGVMVIRGIGEAYGIELSDEDSLIIRQNTTLLVIEEGITELGDEIFAGFIGLKQVVMPEIEMDSDMYIGTCAFAGCKALLSISIPDGEYYIYDGAFSGCTSLALASIPSNTITSGFGIFEGCSLEKLIIRGGIDEDSYIGCYFLDGCKIKEIEIQGKLAYNIFGVEYASDLLPKEVKGEDIVYKDGVVFSKDMTQLIACMPGKKGDYIIPEGVKEICHYAFYGCDNLWSVTIPDTVSKMGIISFHACEELHTVISEAEFKNNIFGACNNLMNIEVKNKNNVLKDNAIYNKDMSTLILSVPGIQGEVSIIDGVTTIGNGAFYARRGLTAIEIPSSVIEIGDRAFDGCRGLSTIEIPDSVTTIGNSAFANCRGLNTIEIPDSVTTIGNSAFWCCDSLSTIEIPDSVTTIGERAFHNCDSLNTIEIPDSVTEIGDYAFWGVDHIYYYGTAGDENDRWGAGERN